MDDFTALQDRLAALESGEQSEKAAMGLAEADASLLFLAAELRELPKPQMAPVVAARQRQRVVRAANALQRPQSGSFQLHWALFPAMGAVFMVVAALLILAVNVIINPPGNRTALLAGVAGIVEVSRDSSGTDWQVAAAGEKIVQGQRLRTRVDSTVMLVFSNGSTSTIMPQSDVVLTRASGGLGGSMQVRLTQLLGETHHQVNPLTGPSSFFEVQAGDGLASVHGTEFDVDVTENGRAIFTVSDGEVHVEAANQQVVLTAGEVSFIQPGQKPGKPAYQFKLQGQISEIQDGRWIINDTPIEVDPATIDAILFQYGDWVIVRGRVMEDGAWVADRASWTEQQLSLSSFTGRVEAAQTDLLTVNGQVVRLVENSKDQNISIGDKISVSFTREQDGSLQALGVESLDEPSSPAAPAPTSTRRPANTATDVPNTAVPTRVPNTSTPIPNTAVPTATEEDTTANTPTSQPTETDTPAPTLPPTTAPTRTPIPPTSTPTGEPSIIVVPTDEPTQAPTATEEPPATDTPEPILVASGCVSEKNKQPEARRLSERYSVSYEEIIGWFCQGFGFGEIDLAYELSQDSQRPVREVFALKSSGVDWGEIKRILSIGSVEDSMYKNKN